MFIGRAGTALGLRRTILTFLGAQANIGTRVSIRRGIKLRYYGKRIRT